MTATTRVTVSRQRLVPWASGVLNLPADASDAQRRARLFAAVREADFIPSPDVEQAIAVLGQSGDDLMLDSVGWQTAKPPKRARAQCEGDVCGLGFFDGGWRALADADRDDARREIEAFAATFFDRPPSQRRRAWQALADRYGHLAAWQCRLVALRPGLRVRAVWRKGDWNLRRLFDHIVATFALPPAERMLRDAAFLRQRRQQPDCWAAAATKLRKRHRKLAKLAPHLVRELVKRGPPQRRSLAITSWYAAIGGMMLLISPVFLVDSLWIGIAGLLLGLAIFGRWLQLLPSAKI